MIKYLVFLCCLALHLNAMHITYTAVMLEAIKTPSEKLNIIALSMSQQDIENIFAALKMPSEKPDVLAKEMSQKDIEKIVVLPEQITNLQSFQAYAAHYAWASSKEILENRTINNIIISTLKNPCLRLENINKEDSFLYRMQEIFKKYPRENSASIVEQNNHYFYLHYVPQKTQQVKWSKQYFKNYLINNHEHLLPDYKHILSQIKIMASEELDQSLNFINNIKKLTSLEIAEMLKSNTLTAEEKDYFINKIEGITHDILRIKNSLDFIANNGSNIQIMDLYLLAEQSFYNLDTIEDVTKKMIESGHFLTASDYAKQNPPIKNFKKFFSHRQIPLRSLYLISRAIAFSLRDFANKLRAQAGLQPIPEEIFEQSQIVKDALEIDESLVNIEDFIRLKNQAKKPTPKIKSPQELEEEHQDWLKDTLIIKKSQKRSKPHKKATKISKHSQSKKMEQPEPTAAVSEEKKHSQAQDIIALEPNIPDISEETTKPSIGLRVYRLLDESNKAVLDHLFEFAPNKLSHNQVNELTMAVYKALIDLNKASRAAEFIKKSSDSRIFTKGKEEKLLSKVSLEHRLLPYLLQAMIPPHFDQESIIQQSQFLRERIGVEKTMLYGDEIDTDMLCQLEKFLSESEDASKVAGPIQKRILLVNLAHAWHKLDIAVDRAKTIGYKAFSQEKHRQKIITLLEQALPIIKANNSHSVSILEAYLYNYYLKIELSPTYKQLSDEQIDAIQQRAAANLLKSAERTIRTIDKISPSGKKIGEYKVYNSIFHAITNNELGDYIIINFERPLRDRKIPLFVYYKDQIYRTDVFGGSRLKPDTAKDDYGSLIAVSLQAGDFFKRWFTSNESFWYGQRAFMPAEANQASKSLRGRLKIATIPDDEQFLVIDNLIVQDGFGYIKASAAEKLELEAIRRHPTPQQKNVAYQAFQAYEAENHREAALELFNGSRKLLAIPNFHSWEASNRANALMTTVSKLTNIGVPVKGNKVILPNNEHWKKFAQKGLLVGRNPYSAQRIQVVGAQNIQGSTVLLNLPVFQYTLTGYYNDSGSPVGAFFKGLLAVIPNEKWPEAYKNAQILVSSKDQKLNQKWLNKKLKDNDQGKKQLLDLNAILAVKNEYYKKHLVGLPVKMAENLAGDYDGDPYDLMSRQGYQHLSAVIIDASKQAIPNPKIDKSFTERQSPGNFNRILDLRKPILPAWNVIINRFYYLLKEERAQLVQDVSQNHMLQQWLGDDWTNKLGIKEISSNDIVIAEMQLGLKYGEDAYKTKVDIESVLTRAREYEKALNKIRPNQEIPYGKALIKKLHNNQDLKSITAPALKPKKSANLPDKAFRGQARFLADDNSYEGWLSDDD